MKRILLLHFCFIPLCVFAHGEDVLSYFFIQFVFINLLLLFLSFIKLPGKKKIFLFLISFTSLIISNAVLFILNLPFSKYSILINSLVVVFPLLTTLIGWRILKKAED